MEIDSSSNLNMRFMKVPEARSFVVETLGNPLLSATHIVQSSFDHGFLDPHVVEDAFMVTLQQKTFAGEMWVDGRRVSPRHIDGTITIYDLRREWRANLLEPFDCVNFYLPRRIIDIVTDGEKVAPVDDLFAKPGQPINDVTVRGIAMALKPALDAPDLAPTLFVDSVGIALAAHLVETYSGSFWQGSKAVLSRRELSEIKELIRSRRDGNLSVTEIADALGLPVRYLCEGFYKAENRSLYGWLQERRIDDVKAALLDKRLTLREVAQSAGFVDMAHFVATFEKRTGINPSDWQIQQ